MLAEAGLFAGQLPARAMRKNFPLASVEALGSVPSTLLIPLAARARGGAMFAHLDPHDRHSQSVLDATGVNAETILSDRVTVLTILWRTELIKRMGREFFARHPQGQGINLGAGLSRYFQWFDNGANNWLDIDLPKVIALRRRFCGELPKHCRNQSLDITQANWWRLLSGRKGRSEVPALLICEGVLMYFAPDSVKAVLQEIGDNAPPGSEVILDFMTPHWLGHAASHPSVASTGAEFTWGVHSGQEMADMHPRLKVLEQHSLSEAYGFAAQMAEHFWHPYTGGAMYGLVRLGLG